MLTERPPRLIFTHMTNKGYPGQEIALAELLTAGVVGLSTQPHGSLTIHVKIAGLFLDRARLEINLVDVFNLHAQHTAHGTAGVVNFAALRLKLQPVATVKQAMLLTGNWTPELEALPTTETIPLDETDKDLLNQYVRSKTDSKIYKVFGLDHSGVGLLCKNVTALGAGTITHVTWAVLQTDFERLVNDVWEPCAKAKPIQNADPVKPDTTSDYPTISVDVFSALVSERRYQEKKWAKHTHTSGEWLLILERCLKKAKAAWYLGDVIDVMSEIRQLTAVGVAAMEECGAPLRASREQD